MINKTKSPENLVFTEETSGKLAELSGEFVTYLLHFTVPIQKKNSIAKHYIGLTKNVSQRFTAHASGKGNGLVFKAFGQGEVIVAQLWKQDGNFEQKLKRYKNASRFCPICTEEKRNARTN